MLLGRKAAVARIFLHTHCFSEVRCIDFQNKRISFLKTKLNRNPYVFDKKFSFYKNSFMLQSFLKSVCQVINVKLNSACQNTLKKNNELWFVLIVSCFSVTEKTFVRYLYVH